MELLVEMMSNATRPAVKTRHCRHSAVDNTTDSLLSERLFDEVGVLLLSGPRRRGGAARRWIWLDLKRCNSSKQLIENTVLANDRLITVSQ